jgi:hypothetical protein
VKVTIAKYRSAWQEQFEQEKILLNDGNQYTDAKTEFIRKMREIKSRVYPRPSLSYSAPHRS